MHTASSENKSIIRKLINHDIDMQSDTVCACVCVFWWNNKLAKLWTFMTARSTFNHSTRDKIFYRFTLFCHYKFAIADAMIEHLVGVSQRCCRWRWQQCRGTPTIQSGIQFIAFFRILISVNTRICRLMTTNTLKSQLLCFTRLFSFYTHTHTTHDTRKRPIFANLFTHSYDKLD